MSGATDAGVVEAFAGRILRTHVLRPTWHFVSPKDIRFLLAPTAPRVNAANASYYRALQGHNHRTRAELAAALARAGIPAAGLRLAYLSWRPPGVAGVRVLQRAERRALERQRARYERFLAQEKGTRDVDPH